MTEHEKIDEFIEQIEQKYVSGGTVPTNEVQQQLHILSQEFETLGLPSIDLQTSGSRLLRSIVNNSFLLVQSYRKTLLQVTEENITHRLKDVKQEDLQKSVLNLKAQLKSKENQNTNLERKLFKLNSENEELRKKMLMHNTETQKLKHFFNSKENQFVHHINKLKNENHHLKEMCVKDLDKYFSKEEKFLKILRTYRQKEEMYCEALKKLEENNAEIMNEILNLKNELALVYLKEN
ncbi:uncharacterized protein LOC135143172 [Zophobas morio]|uniref:uncharacterized protein LOC135143172 n=1 Tax=Zophobas morio TaxID=2755281 RepID=UPI003082FEB2